MLPLSTGGDDCHPVSFCPFVFIGDSKHWEVMKVKWQLAIVVSSDFYQKPQKCFNIDDLNAMRIMIKCQDR